MAKMHTYPFALYEVQRDEALYDIGTVFEEFYLRQDEHCRVKGQAVSCRNLYFPIFF